jgi:hypothetical protein
MTKDQQIYVSMINSFNLITEKATIEEIIYSGIGIFAHIPNEDIDEEDVNILISYFESRDMYEYCSELIDFINEEYNSDGSFKQKECECEYPIIKKYIKKMKCSRCDLRLRRR